jgi:type IV secretion system protein VirB6
MLNILDVLEDVEQSALDWLVMAAVRMQAFISGESGLLASLLILFFVVWGYMLLTGYLQLSLRDTAGKVLLVLLVGVLSTNLWVLTDYLIPFFIDGPEQLASIAVGGSGTSDVRETLDRVFRSGLEAGQRIWDQGSSWSFGPATLAFGVWGATLLSVGYAVFLLLLAKLAIAVMLALTPLMFLALLFQTTRSIFERWLGFLFSFAMIPVLTFLLISFMAGVAESTADAIVDASTRYETIRFGVVAPFLLVAAALFLLLMQVNGMAAGLGGTIAVSTMGAASAAIGRVARQFSPGQKRYFGGDGLEGRARTALRDIRRAAQVGNLRRAFQRRGDSK